jgi:hypothetical protein
MTTQSAYDPCSTLYYEHHWISFMSGPATNLSKPQDLTQGMTLDLWSSCVDIFSFSLFSCFNLTRQVGLGVKEGVDAFHGVIKTGPISRVRSLVGHDLKPLGQCRLLEERLEVTSF